MLFRQLFVLARRHFGARAPGDVITTSPHLPLRIPTYGEVARVVTGAGDRFNVWTLDPDTWPQLACLIAGRPMTMAEWDQVGPRDEQITDSCAALVEP